MQMLIFPARVIWLYIYYSHKIPPSDSFVDFWNVEFGSCSASFRIFGVHDSIGRNFKVRRKIYFRPFFSCARLNYLVRDLVTRAHAIISRANHLIVSCARLSMTSVHDIVSHILCITHIMYHTYYFCASVEPTCVIL
jgi:hypothetical protein